MFNSKLSILETILLIYPQVSTSFPLISFHLGDSYIPSRSFLADLLLVNLYSLPDIPLLS